MAGGKIFVIYDDTGAIKATAATSHEHAAIKSTSGHSVHAIDHPGLSGEELKSFLVELHRRNRIARGSEPRLVRIDGQRGA